jgi:hypothetical protein
LLIISVIANGVFSAPPQIGSVRENIDHTKRNCTVRLSKAEFQERCLKPLAADIIELARQCGRYGSRKAAALLRQAGWTINYKRVERIWQREGLKAPVVSRNLSHFRFG